MTSVAQAMFTWLFLCLFVVVFFFQDFCKWRVWMPSCYQCLRGNWRFLSSFKTKVFKTLQLGKASQSRDWSTKNTTGRDELYWGTRKLREGMRRDGLIISAPGMGRRSGLEPWVKRGGRVRCVVFSRQEVACVASVSVGLGSKKFFAPQPLGNACYGRLI